MLLVVGDAVRELVGETELVAVREADAVRVDDCEGATVRDAVRVALTVADAVTLGDGVLEGSSTTTTVVLLPVQSANKSPSSVVFWSNVSTCSRLHCVIHVA